MCGGLIVGWRVIILAFSVPSYLLPTPLEVVKVAWLRLPDLWTSLMISAEAATGGLLASIVVGVLIALIFARSQWVRKMFFPVYDSVADRAVPRGGPADYYLGGPGIAGGWCCDVCYVSCTHHCEYYTGVS